MPVDRGICCHVGGDIVFDGAGNLLLSTGDDTNPFESDGYTPIDERAGRNPAFDAQRTSANTNDLRGKILRITVGASGGYTIPAGNLFVDQNPLTRPEIYLMGLRNPFRIEFNQRTGELYVADYSPDASAPNPLRGPAGPGQVDGGHGARQLRLAVLRHRRSCRTSTTTSPPASRAPRSTAPRRSTSRRTTPASRSCRRSPSRTSGTRTGRPRSSRQLGTGGIGPMAGPAYQYDAKLASKKGSTAWPAYYDNVPLFYEWTRDYIKAFFTRAAT